MIPNVLEIPAIFFPNKREKEKTLFQGLKTANYPKTFFFPGYFIFCQIDPRE